MPKIQPNRKPRESANHIYYPGLQLEIRHKRSTVIATVLEYISKTKILTKIKDVRVKYLKNTVRYNAYVYYGNINTEIFSHRNR